jgi:hypothetical protein
MAASFDAAISMIFFTHVFRMLRPAARDRTLPRPPAELAARLFAAVIRPPLLLFAIFFDLLVGSFYLMIGVHGLVTVHESSVAAPMRANALPFNDEPVFSVTA